ncbi:hypothetical protein ACFL1G_12475, partial [Planctomycetota bacterium]
LQQETEERKRLEERLAEQTAELTAVNKQLQKEIIEHQKLEEITRGSTEKLDELIGRNGPLDEQELESLAEMAKQLSGKG